MTKTLRSAAALLLDAAVEAAGPNATRWLEANAPDQRTLDAAFDIKAERERAADREAHTALAILRQSDPLR